MKLIYLTLFLLANHNMILCQNYSPSVIILSPSSVKIDGTLKKEYKEFKKLTSKMASAEKEKGGKLASEAAESNLPENLKIIEQKRYEFSKVLNDQNAICRVISTKLLVDFYETFPNLLIYSVDSKSNGTIESLLNLSEEHKARYIVNIPSIEILGEGTTKKAKISFQVYDKFKQKIVLQKTYEGDSSNPGFYFACTEGSIMCTESNAAKKFTQEFVRLVLDNNQTIIKSRELRTKRSEILYTDYFNRVRQNEVNLIVSKNTDYDTTGFVQAISNSDKSKFIAFYTISDSQANFKELRKNKTGGRVNIEMDNFNFDKLPEYYSFIIIGILYNNKWYFDQRHRTFFDANSLNNAKVHFFNRIQGWNFFIDGEAKENPAFWETGFFNNASSEAEVLQKEIDLLKSDGSISKSDLKYYEELIEEKKLMDKENEKYFGIPNIVVRAIKDSIENYKESLDAELSKSLIIPLVNNYMKTNNIDSYTGFKDEKARLITNEERTYLLCPLIFKSNDKKTLFYFFLLKTGDNYEVFIYDYFEEKKASEIGPAVYQDLNPITGWNWSYEYLNDSSFWQEKVLKKKNGEYLYLKKVNF